MRIVFMGTPEFAVPSLEALVGAGHTVCAAFSQPDRPKGRGMKLQPTPVKVCAQSHSIPVHQPQSMRDEEVLALLEELNPDLIVVAAYGRLLPDSVLSLPRLGCINVHSSLLPRYRGAAPINWAVLNGERETGVTIMDMAHELDAGDVISQVRTPIPEEEDADALYHRLARLGGELLVETVAALEEGRATRTPQDPALVTQAPMLSKALSPMDWTRPARDLHNQVRGLLPWPVASTDVLTGDTVRIYRTQVLGPAGSARPGAVVAAGKQGIDVACGDGNLLRILELQATGGKRMGAGAYLLGHPIRVESAPK